MDSVVGKIVWLLVFVFLGIPLILLIIPVPNMEISDSVMNAIVGNGGIADWYHKIEFFLPIGFIIDCAIILLTAKIVVIMVRLFTNFAGVLK